MNSPGMNGRRRSILVADDNEDCRLALRSLLESRGYTVLEARNGQKALEIARHSCPDLILMDLMMPEVDGLEATRRIRADGHLADTPIVAVSAMEEARSASLSAGCDDCVPKPIDLDSIGERIDRWIASH